MASGVLDMVGNIYQWTDEVCDDHTCRGIVRGGNNYYPRGSQWCKPQTSHQDHSVFCRLVLLHPS